MLLTFNGQTDRLPTLKLFSNTLEKKVERGLRLLDNARNERLTYDDAASGTILRRCAGHDEATARMLLALRTWQSRLPRIDDDGHTSACPGALLQLQGIGSRRKKRR